MLTERFHLSQPAQAPAHPVVHKQHLGSLLVDLQVALTRYHVGAFDILFASIQPGAKGKSFIEV
jgi:hypothetical protein